MQHDGVMQRFSEPPATRAVVFNEFDAIGVFNLLRKSRTDVAASGNDHPSVRLFRAAERIDKLRDVAPCGKKE